VFRSEALEFLIEDLSRTGGFEAVLEPVPPLRPYRPTVAVACPLPFPCALFPASRNEIGQDGSAEDDTIVAKDQIHMFTRVALNPTTA
jgi:hypothetical protein